MLGRSIKNDKRRVEIYYRELKKYPSALKESFYFQDLKG